MKRNLENKIKNNKDKRFSSVGINNNNNNRPKTPAKPTQYSKFNNSNNNNNNNELITNKNNSNIIITNNNKNNINYTGNRPKKCYNCNKLIAANKYNQHYQVCFRYKNQDKVNNVLHLHNRIEHQKNRQIANSNTNTNTNTNINTNTNKIQNPQKNYKSPVIIDSKKTATNNIISQQQQAEQKQQLQLNNTSSKFRIRDFHQMNQIHQLTHLNQTGKNKNKNKNNSSQIKNIKRTSIRNYKKQQEKQYEKEEEMIGDDYIKFQKKQNYKQQQFQSSEEDNNKIIRMLEPTSSQMSRRQKKLKQFDQNYEKRQDFYLNQQQSSDSIILNEYNEPVSLTNLPGKKKKIANTGLNYDNHQQDDNVIRDLQRVRQRQIYNQNQRERQLQLRQLQQQQRRRQQEQRRQYQQRQQEIQRRVQRNNIRENQQRREHYSLDRGNNGNNLPEYQVSISNGRPFVQQINNNRRQQQQQQTQSNSNQNTNIRIRNPQGFQGPNQITINMQQQMNQLIFSTNQIIQFVQSMNGLSDQDQGLSIMITQLRQLTHIAGQIRDLDNIGTNLGFRMGSVFARRIKQLHTTIINQIGITLIRRFHDRVSTLALNQFQQFLDRQPQLRTGFSKQQIQRVFPDKMNYKTNIDCSICLQDIKIGIKIKELQCNHKFHPDCIQHWLEASKQCPMCRTQQQVQR